MGFLEGSNASGIPKPTLIHVSLAYVDRGNNMPTRLERLTVMANEINGQRYPTVDHFCREFEVQQRTVYEDIRILKENLGMEIAYDRFRNGYYNANPSKKLPSFELTDGELFALLLGKEMLSQYTGTAFEQPLRTAIEKISQRLPDRVQIDFKQLSSMVSFHPGAVIPISRKLFLDLNRACEKRLPTDITYYAASKNQTSKRLVHPLRLLENRGTWYMAAFDTMRKDMRLFALHRIQEYKLRNERFRPPAGLDIDAWLKSAFQLEHGDEVQKVRVRFGMRAAPYIRERKWHTSQKLTEFKDGTCVLEFETRNLEEVKRWVLVYGAEAEVLKPDRLREMVARELQGAMRHYSTTVKSRMSMTASFL